MPEDCVQQECCPPDPYAYRSTDGEDSLTGSNNECAEIVVAISPVSGSYVFFPSYIVLTTGNEDAAIYYTTDGTDPTEASTLYTEPFEITQAGTLIKARAVLPGCSLGPIAAALYQNPPFPIGLDYSCTTPDKVGDWGVWAPDSNIDSFWRLEFVLTGNQAIKRLELKQLNSSGLWTTGILYSTDSPIESFNAMPLGLFIGGVQQHTDYQASLGTFGAGTHTWDLYGNKHFSSDGGFWQLDMVLGDDSRVTAYKRTNCSNSVDPTPCPSPPAPTATPKCDGAVDVTFVGDMMQTYRLYVSAGAGWTLVSTSAVGFSPKTIEVTGLNPGGLYYFRVELEYAGCGFQSSPQVTAVPLLDPEVTIATDKTIVDPNESFTISWTSNHIGGATCGGCADGQVSINQGLGCKAGNASGSQATSKPAAGIYTYEITACNACGTVTASVQVEVRDVAGCVGEQPSILHIANPTTFLCGFVAGCARPPGSTSGPAWNGELALSGTCRWSSNVSIHPWGGCSTIGGGSPPEIGAQIEFAGGVWVLDFTSTGSLWSGTKALGSTPLGTYTRTSGCATGPATITLT